MTDFTSKNTDSPGNIITNTQKNQWKKKRQEIFNLYDKHKNCSEVARIVGLSRQRVHVILKKYKIIAPKTHLPAPQCPFCLSHHTSHYGKDSYSGFKRYGCNNCKRMWRDGKVYDKSNPPKPTKRLMERNQKND